MRVYVINIDLVEDVYPVKLSNEEFMNIAEEQGLVYTLLGFQDAFNECLVNTDNCFIRFI